MSPRALAKAAGMTTLSQVWNTLQRLDRDPGAVELGTLHKIAAGGGVNFKWLLTGEGPRDADARVAYDDPYPARSAALTPFRESSDANVQAVVRMVASMEFQGASALAVDGWTKLFVRRLDEIRELGGAMPPPSSDAELDAIAPPIDLHAAAAKAKAESTEPKRSKKTREK